MNENYTPIDNNNNGQNVQMNNGNQQMMGNSAPMNNNYEFNANDVVYADDGSYNASNKKDGKKILLYVLGIVIIIIIILLLLKFCGTGGRFTGIKIGDVPIMYVDEEYKVPVSAVGKGDRSNTAFEFSIKDDDIAELDQRYQTGSDVNAEIEALEPGTTKLEVIGQLGKTKLTAEADVIVCGVFKIEGIADDTISVNVGQKKPIGLNIGDDEKCYQGLTFTFADTSFAKISGPDEIEGVAKGETTLTVSDGQNEHEYKVVVSDPGAAVLAESISLNVKSKTICINSRYTLKASIKPIDTTDKSISWTSSNSSVASVSQGGKVSAKKVGTVTITVNTNDGSDKITTAKIKVSKCTVTPKPTKVKVKSITLNPTALSIPVGGTGTITAGIKPTNASNKTVSCSSSNTTIFTVTASGNKCTVKGVGVGSATLTVVAKDGSKVKKTATITVTSSGGTNPTPTPTPTPPPTPAVTKTCYCADNIDCVVRDLGSKDERTCKMSCRTGTPGWGSKPNLSASCGKKCTCVYATSCTTIHRQQSDFAANVKVASSTISGLSSASACANACSNKYSGKISCTKAASGGTATTAKYRSSSFK